MSPTDLRVALLRAGVRQMDIARACGSAPANVYAVVHGKTRSLRIERAIASALGLSLVEVWPDRCPHCGSRRRETEAVAS